MILLDHLNANNNFLRIYDYEGMGFGYISGEEYIVEGTNTNQLEFGIPVSDDKVEIISYDKKYLHMWVRCVNQSEEVGYIELPLLHYTGYRAYVTATGEELPTQKGTNNVVRVEVPEEFEGEIEVKFVSPLHWRISEIVTYMWWIVMIGVFVKKDGKDRAGSKR